MWRAYALLALALPAVAAPADPDSSAVARILESKCLACHQPGGIAPMPLSSWELLRPWARSMRNSIARNAMPPWHADEASSRLLRDVRALSPAEKKTLLAWLDRGAPADPQHPLAAPAQPTGWRLGQPDLIVKIPGMAVPAQGTLEYAFLVSRLNLPQDQWIAAAEWKIDKPAVVHHINAFLRPPGSSYVAEAPLGQIYTATRGERAARKPGEREVDRRELLLGYEPGYLPQSWGEGRAKLLRAQSDLVFEMHYTPNGAATTDSSELGLYFAKAAPQQRVFTITPADADLLLPPGAPNVKSEVSATLTQPAELISLQPHMHLRGKAYEVVLRRAGERPEILLNVPKYDFHWQTTYFLAKPLPLAAGDAIECSAWFDNSPNNRNNPDPRSTVRWGDQSWEEMNICFLELAVPLGQDPDVAKLSGTTRPNGGRTDR